MAILLVHLALGVFYSVTIPLWESYDENGHYAYVHYLREHWRLPAPDEPVGEMGWQLRQQPPLYYVLGALTTFWYESDEAWEPVTNPWFGDATTGGYNLFLHTEREAFPYHGVALVVHVLRLVSVFLSTVTVILVYLTARVMFPKERDIALGAAALISFAPQFLFLGSVITNDIAVATFSSAALFFLVYALVRGARWQVLVGFWFSFFLAMLSKVTAIYLAPLALLALLLPLAELALKRLSSVRASLASGAVFFGAAAVVVVSLWRMWGFFGRSGNMVLEGIRSALWTSRNATGLPAQAPDLSAYRGYGWYWFQTFWASFGWGNIGVATWVYWVLLALCLLSACGGLMALFRRQNQLSAKLAIGVLALSVGCIMAVMTYPYFAFGRFAILYGRYSFPALPAVCLLLAVGLAHLVPQIRLRRVTLGMTTAGMLAFAVLVPFYYIMPVYARPPLVSEEGVQAIPNRLNANFDHKIELLGWEMDTDRVQPGGELRVTLYWRCLAEMSENYALALKLTGADGGMYGRVHTHPGHGNYPTTLWRRGQVIRDEYRLRITPELPGQSLARLSVGFFRPPLGREPLPAYDTRGEAIGGEVIVARAKVAARPVPPGSTVTLVGVPASYRLGDDISLIGYELSAVPRQSGGPPLRLALYWRANRRVQDDYTVFVHVVHNTGALVAQRDSPPRQGAYPTSLWDEGEIVIDGAAAGGLTLAAGAPPGDYEIRVGMYRSESQERLPVLDSASVRQRGDYIVLGHFQMAGPAKPSP